MYTLFLDTHDELITISFINGIDLYTKEEISENSHSEHLLPMLDKMLKEKHITLKNFDKVIVVNGPGSFTGIRIGLTVAKTICYALNIPIYIVSSLKCYLLSSKVKNKVLCVIEDNKGYYISGYDSEGKIIEEKYITSLEEYKDYQILKNELDINEIVNYVCTLKPESVHGVKANYIKKIEALK